jgi:hypothetical protein
MKSLLSLLIGALVLVGCGGNKPTARSSSPRAKATEGQTSPAAEKSGGDCKLMPETEIEAIVGSDVDVKEGSCSFETTNQSGLNGTWEIDNWSEASWEGMKRQLGGEPHPGIGDEAYSKDSGGLAQIAVKKGKRQLILTVADTGGMARDLMVKLAEKIVAAM